MKSDILRYYTRHTALTDPGEFVEHLNALPVEMGALHAALGGLLIHIWRIQRDHPDLLSERSDEIKIRHVRRLLERCSQWMSARSPFLVMRSVV